MKRTSVIAYLKSKIDTSYTLNSSCLFTLSVSENKTDERWSQWHESRAVYTQHRQLFALFYRMRIDDACENTIANYVTLENYLWKKCWYRGRKCSFDITWGKTAGYHTSTLTWLLFSTLSLYVFNYFFHIDVRICRLFFGCCKSKKLLRCNCCLVFVGRIVQRNTWVLMGPD